MAHAVNQVHQVDSVGPCNLRGPLRFRGVHTDDLATPRCALQSVRSRAGQAVLGALWATWQRLGLPAPVQVDNEMVCCGSPPHPRGMGWLIRLCLGRGIEPWCIPVREAWRNGVVEKFNDHYGSKLLARAIWSDRRLDVFGERFLLPPEAEYAYVVATVHVAQQRLRVVLGADPVAELASRLR